MVPKNLRAAARKSAAAKGEARPDGSFPIRNAKDLRNAKHDIGRASNPAAAREWVNKRAKALNLPGVGQKTDKVLKRGRG